MKNATIEKGVPLPGHEGKGARVRYPFGQMGPGDSILLDRTGAASFRNYAYRHAWRSTTRTESPGVIRCWRAA